MGAGPSLGAICSQYACWDGIYPTTAAHMAIANAMAKAVPEPQTHALFSVGLVALALHTRRRVKRPAVAA